MQHVGTSRLAAGPACGNLLPQLRHLRNHTVGAAHGCAWLRMVAHGCAWSRLHMGPALDAGLLEAAHGRALDPSPLLSRVGPDFGGLSFGLRRELS